MILDKFKLDGKVAIVTGASRGLGKAMAIGLAQAGADIAAVARGDLSDTKNEIEKLHRKCLCIKADLAQSDSADKIVKEVTAEFNTIDILVNNAGIIRRAPITEFTEKDWDDVINVNLKSVFMLSQAFAKALINQDKGGKIINIASMLSFQGGILIPSYTAAKSGVVGLTRILANELAKHNINVNAIAPGYFKTDATAALQKDPVRSKAILARIPTGRWGEPEDLMGAAVFLASDASAYMQGYTIAVDGGWLSR